MAGSADGCGAQPRNASQGVVTGPGGVGSEKRALFLKSVRIVEIRRTQRAAPARGHENCRNGVLHGRKQDEMATATFVADPP